MRLVLGFIGSLSYKCEFWLAHLIYNCILLAYGKIGCVAHSNLYGIV